jgi:nitrogen fixation protein FixH
LTVVTSSKNSSVILSGWKMVAIIGYFFASIDDMNVRLIFFYFPTIMVD